MEKIHEKNVTDKGSLSDLNKKSMHIYQATTEILLDNKEDEQAVYVKRN